MLARVHPFLHVVHGRDCAKRWALISARRFAEVMAGCTCRAVKYRPVTLARLFTLSADERIALMALVGRMRSVVERGSC